VCVTVPQNAETVARRLRSLRGVTTHRSNPVPSVCANKFQAGRIKIALNVQSRNNRPISVAILVQPNGGQNFQERFPNFLTAHITRDPAGERQPHFHFPAPTGQEIIESVALAVPTDGHSHGSHGDDASFRKLPFGHKVLQVQSCPHDHCKLSPGGNSRTPESKSCRRPLVRESLHDIPQSTLPSAPEAKSERSIENFCGAGWRRSLATEPVNLTIGLDQRIHRSSRNARKRHQTAPVPNQVPEIHRPSDNSQNIVPSSRAYNAGQSGFRLRSSVC